MASSHIVPMWKRNFYGKLDTRHVGGDQVEQAKIDGWFDSPDKVPDPLPGATITLPPQQPPVGGPAHQGPIGSVHGEVTKADKAAVRAKAMPRVNGRFAKARA